MTHNTVERIRKIRADALYGKKKHFNAADRKQRYQTRASVTVILLNVLLGSALFAYTKDSVPDVMRWTAGAIALLAAGIAALQSYFSWAKAVQGHRQVAGRYLDIVKLCSNTIAKHSDGLVDDDELSRHLDSVSKALNKINEESQAFPTNSSDYIAAKKGLDQGEEDYTERELTTGE